LFGDFQRALPPPGFDGGMIAGEQDVWHLPPAKAFGSGVVWVVENSGGERILDGAAFIAQHAWDKADDRIGDDESSQRSIREHVVPNGNFVIRQVISDTLVNAFVMTRDEDQMAFARVSLGYPLVEPPTLWAHQNDTRPLPTQGVQGSRDRLDFHDHSGPAAVGSVIGGAVLIGCPRAKINGLERCETFFLSAFEDAFS
jgi:hypothetical protein